MESIGLLWTIVVEFTCFIFEDLDIDDEKLTQIWHTDPAVPFYVQWYGLGDRESYTYSGAIQFRLVRT